MTVLERINSLQHYDGLKTVKDVLKSIFSSITSLETNSVIIIKNTALSQSIAQTSGSLVLGGLYFISDVLAGDNFTNTGFIDTNKFFIATSTTPTSWSNGSSVLRFQSIANIPFNDVDINLIFKAHAYNNLGGTLLTITNNKFIDNKIFVANASYKYIDTNNIFIHAPTSKDTKIEVYN